MAKAKFNRDEVLDNAIDLFWEHGYKASSMQQVVKATGLKPGSIYLAFDNKDGLFKESLERYAETSATMIKKTIDDAPSIGKGICTYFDNIIQNTKTTNYSSCFLIKSSLELAIENKDLHNIASHNLNKIEVLFCNYLEKEYGKKDAKQRATSIMLLTFGLRTYGYRTDSISRMKKGVREALPWLPWA